MAILYDHPHLSQADTAKTSAGHAAAGLKTHIFAFSTRTVKFANTDRSIEYGFSSLTKILCWDQLPVSFAAASFSIPLIRIPSCFFKLQLIRTVKKLPS